MTKGRGGIRVVREKYYNTREVAEILSMGQGYLRQLLKEEKIKGVKVGHKKKASESEVKRLSKV